MLESYASVRRSDVNQRNTFLVIRDCESLLGNPVVGCELTCFPNGFRFHPSVRPQ